MTIRVVVAEDSALVREGMVRILEQPGTGIEVVGIAVDLPSLLAEITRTRPDVVVTDVRMPPSHTDEGLRAAAFLQVHRPAVGPAIGVVLVTAAFDPGAAAGLPALGTARLGYLLKDSVAEPGEFVAAVRKVAAGGTVFDPRLVSAMLAARQISDSMSELTAAESDVLACVAQGHSNTRIARDLQISDRAVEKRITSIFRKLQIYDEPDDNRRVRAALMYLASESGLESRS